jgi:hypothetical protein
LAALNYQRSPPDARPESKLQAEAMSISSTAARRTLRIRSYLSYRTMSTTPPTYPLVQNATRPKGWKAAAPFASPGQSTYGHQGALPRLPVPKLDDTVSRLKESLRPLARGKDELTTAENKVDALASGLGQELQRRLLKRQSETDHWLEEWWDDGAYMTYRDSVIVNVSYFCKCLFILSY